MVQHCEALGRAVQVVNLDPAAELFSYPVMAGERRPSVQFWTSSVTLKRSPCCSGRRWWKIVSAKECVILASVNNFSLVPNSAYVRDYWSLVIDFPTSVIVALCRLMLNPCI